MTAALAPKFPLSTKPAPLFCDLSRRTVQHRSFPAPWSVYSHPLQNRVPRVQVLLPLPKKRDKHLLASLFSLARIRTRQRGTAAPLRSACRGGLQPGGLRPGPTEATAETSPSAPATNPAETLCFCRVSFCMWCMGMGFVLVQTPGFPIRFYPFSTVSTLSSTQNAPGFAFFGPNRVRFALFVLL